MRRSLAGEDYRTVSAPGCLAAETDGAANRPASGTLAP